MLSKESKIRVLENFYALDYVLFGKPVKDVEFCCPLVKEEYVSIKGALMSVFVEMLKLVDHKPQVVKEKLNSKAIMKNARSSAKVARENSEKIVSSAKARSNIKAMLKEELHKDPKVNVSNLVEKAIRSKAFSLAIDNLLVARSLVESKDLKGLSRWEGQIIEDSYKILRDNLVEAAYMILYDNEGSDKKKVIKEEAISYSGSKIINLASQYGRSIEMKERAGCEKWSVKAPFKGQDYRNKMLSCKAKATIKGINAKAQFAKKLMNHCKDINCKKKLQSYFIDLKDDLADNKSYLTNK